MDKTKPSNAIMLLEKGKVVTANSEISKIPNSYLTNTVTSLSITEPGSFDQLKMKSYKRPP